MAMITILDLLIMALIGIYGSVVVIFILRNWGGSDDE